MYSREISVWDNAQRSSPDGRGRTFKSIMEGRKIHPYKIYRVDT
nr:MAG TPA: hypothetical protein [Caudoviricetes sp.]